jgi:hypothetical protein
MKPGFPATIFFAALIALCACQKNGQPTPSSGALESRKIEFVPPADSAVTVNQAVQWLACNAYLDSLSVLYKDSLSGHDAAQQTMYQDHYLRAQDRICVRLGIQGGYQEYLWILKNLGNPKNKRIADSLKLSTFR